MLDCGHEAKPHGCATGYGIAPDGRKLCDECCASVDRAAIAKGKPIVAYLSGGPNGGRVTTWPGVDLGRAFDVRTHVRYTPTGGRYTDVRFRAHVAGRLCYGRGPGFGMYCRVRPYAE